MIVSIAARRLGEGRHVARRVEVDRIHAERLEDALAHKILPLLARNALDQITGQHVHVVLVLHGIAEGGAGL